MRAIYKIHIVEQVRKHPRQQNQVGEEICLIHVTKVFLELLIFCSTAPPKDNFSRSNELGKSPPEPHSGQACLGENLHFTTVC